MTFHVFLASVVFIVVSALVIGWLVWHDPPPPEDEDDTDSAGV